MVDAGENFLARCSRRQDSGTNGATQHIDLDKYHYHLEVCLRKRVL